MCAGEQLCVQVPQVSVVLLLWPEAVMALSRSREDTQLPKHSPQVAVRSELWTPGDFRGNGAEGLRGFSCREKGGERAAWLRTGSEGARCPFPFHPSNSLCVGGAEERRNSEWASSPDDLTTSLHPGEALHGYRVQHWPCQIFALDRGWWPFGRWCQLSPAPALLLLRRRKRRSRWRKRRQGRSFRATSCCSQHI